MIQDWYQVSHQQTCCKYIFMPCPMYFHEKFGV